LRYGPNLLLSTSSCTPSSSKIMSNSNEKSKPISSVQRVASWLAHIFALTSLGLVIAWAGGTDKAQGYLGGFNWTNNTFNFHPVMMVGGLLVVGTEGMLAYRFWPFGHCMNKIIHGCLHTIGLVMVIVGLIAAFLSHNSVTHGGMKPNLYTAHGFVGIFVVTLFFFQYIMGISAFVVPAIRTKIASAWVPLHRFLGTFCYFGALMAAGMGIAEKTGFNASPATYVQPDINPALHYKEMGAGYKIAFGLPITLLFAAFFATFAAYDFPSTDSKPVKDNTSVEDGGDVVPVEEAKAE